MNRKGLQSVEKAVIAVRLITDRTSGLPQLSSLQRNGGSFE